MKFVLTRLILAYIAFWARIAVKRSRATIVGITGSVGKTSTRDAVHAVLRDSYKTYVIKKGNSETGVPLGLLGLSVSSIGFDSLSQSLIDWLQLLIKAPLNTSFLRKYKVVVVEMGVDSPHPPKNMSHLLSIVQPHISLFINVSGVHGENYEGVVATNSKEAIVQAIAHEKAKIITENPSCTYAIYNHDSPHIAHELSHITLPHATFGLTHESDIHLADYTLAPEGTTYTCRLRSGKLIKIAMKGFVLPRSYFEVFAPAILVGLHMKCTVPEIETALAKHYVLEPGRCSLIEGVHDSLIIDSSYNASPEAMLSMLDMAKSLSVSTGRPLVFVCGDMRELGKQAAHEHDRVYEACLDTVAQVYAVGPLSMKYIATKLSKNTNIPTHSFMNPHDAGKELKRHLPKQALVLFKGSQNTIYLEEAIKYILKTPTDSTKLPRQEKYWMHKKQHLLDTH